MDLCHQTFHLPRLPADFVFSPGKPGCHIKAQLILLVNLVMLPHSKTNQDWKETTLLLSFNFQRYKRLMPPILHWKLLVLQIRRPNLMHFKWLVRTKCFYNLLLTGCQKWQFWGATAWEIPRSLIVNKQWK